MAYPDIPRLEDYLPGLTFDAPPAPPPASRTPAPAPEPVDYYAQLTPAQRKQVDLKLNPRSALGEIGTGLAHGALYELPSMIGQAMRAPGQPGDALYDAGQAVENFVQPNDVRFALDQNPENHGAVVQAFAQGADMLAPSLAPLALVPFTGGGSLGLAAAGAAGAGLFGASQFTQTYDKAKAAGLSDDDARAAALKTSTIEGAGEFAGEFVGGKFLTGAGKLGMRLLGRQMGVPEALDAIRNPKFLREFGKDIATTAGVETGTEMGQNYGEAAVEKAAGIDKTDPWDAATSAIGPTLAMTAMLGPFGGFAMRRQQNRNQSLLDVVETGQVAGQPASISQISGASRELADQMAPLVGEQTAQEWRLDALADINSRNVNAAQQTEAQRQQAINEQINPPTLPALPAPTQIAGLIGDRSATDVSTAEADANAARVYAARDAEERRQQNAQAEARVERASSAIVATPPEGALTFPEFVKQAQNARVGELAKGGRITQAGLQQAYVSYLTDFAQQRAQTAQQVSPDQGALDLDHPNKPAPVRPAEPDRTPAPRNAMELAMQKAREQQAVKDRAVAYDTAEKAANAQKQAQLDAIARQGDTNPLVERRVENNPIYADRVKEANAQADAALAGEINGNTPVTHAGLMYAWRSAAQDAGIDVSVLKGQNAKRVETAIKTAQGKPMWVQQLNALRKARESFKEGTTTRDSMDAFIAKLENFNGIPPETRSNEAAGTPAGQVVQGSQPQPAASQAVAVPAASAGEKPGGQGTAQAKPVAQARQEVAALAPSTAEVTNAVSTGQQPTGDLAERPNGDRGGETAATGGGHRALTGDEETILDAFAETPTDAERAAQAERAGVEPYHFESFPYDPEEPHGGHGSNAQWTDSFERAVRDAAGLDDSGKPLKQTEQVRRRMQYAKQALAGLVDSEREGPDVLRLGQQRVEQLARTRATEGAIGERMRVLSKRLREQIDREHLTNEHARLTTQLQEAAARFRRNPENAALRDEANRLVSERKRVEARLKATLDNDPDAHAAMAEGPAYSYDKALADVLKSGKLDDALAHLEANAPTQWARDLAGLLRGLKLDTKIELINDLGKTENGKMAFGSYNHTANRIRIFMGGENVHTVLHETVHAATLGRLRLAFDAEKVAPESRTAEQRSAVADLAILRRLIDSARFYDTGKQYALKNEAEFLAEVLSNENFQNWLHEQPFEDRSLWDAIKEWFANVLHAFMPHEITAVEAGMYVGMRFATGSRFGALTGDVFHAPASAMDGVNRTGQALNARWQRVLENSDALANAPSKLRAALLMAGTTYHIQRWIEKIPALRNLVPGMEKFFSADGVKTSLLRTKRGEFYSIAKQLYLAMADLSNAERKAMGAKLMRFAGEMSRLNVDLNKNFDQNLKLTKDLDPTLRAYINDLHQQYLTLPDKYRLPLEETFRVNRKNYIQTTATLLATHLRTYKGIIGSPSEGLLAKLDILAPDLFAATANAKPLYYHDAYTAALDKKLNDVFAALDAPHINAELRSDFAEIRDFYRAAVANPYQHLGRTGDYFVEFDLARNAASLAAVQQTLDRFNKVLGQPNKDNTHVFLRFENQAQMLAARNELSRLGEGAVMKDSLKAGSLYDRGVEQRMQGVPAFIRRALDKLEGDLAGKGVNVDPQVLEQIRTSMKRLYLDALPDSSAQKALARRKEGGVIGYDADFIRNFSNRAEGMSSMLANAYTMPLYDNAFDAIKDQVNALKASDPQSQTHASAVYRELAIRFANSLNPVQSPIVDRVKAFGYSYYLAFSPSFWLTNLMQPWHLTLPTLGGRYGFVRTAKEMGKASGLALKIVRDTLKAGAAEGGQAGGVKGAALGILDMELLTDKAGLTKGQSEFVARLLAAGQLDNTQSRELGTFASGTPLGLSAAAKLLSIGSHYTEVVNRLTAGIAAYNLELARSGDAELATRRGIEAVRDTQYDYSDHNTGRAFGRHGVAGKVTPLLTSFQNYAFQTTELLLRLTRDAFFQSVSAEDQKAARKALAGVLGTTTLIAGSLGLPMASVVARLFNAVGGDDDDPADVQSAYRAWLADVFGPEFGEALARGVPRAVLGFDLSQRAGLQDILPGTRFITDRRALKDQLSDGAFNMLGPAVSGGRDLAVGVGNMLDGRILDGLIEALPLALRGPAKAIKLETSGFTNSTGNKLPIEVNGWDEFVQSLGFTPSKKAEQSEANFAFKTRDTILKQEKGRLSNKLYTAIEQGADTSDILQEVQAFNEKNPQYRIHPQQALRARAKARGVAEVSGTDIETLPRYLPLLDRYSYAVTH